MNIHTSSSQPNSAITARQADRSPDLIYVSLGYDAYMFLTRTEAHGLIEAIAPLLAEPEVAVPISI